MIQQKTILRSMQKVFCDSDLGQGKTWTSESIILGSSTLAIKELVPVTPLLTVELCHWSTR